MSLAGTWKDLIFLFVISCSGATGCRPTFMVMAAMVQMQGAGAAELLVAGLAAEVASCSVDRQVELQRRPTGKGQTTHLSTDRVTQCYRR